MSGSGHTSGSGGRRRMLIGVAVALGAAVLVVGGLWLIQRSLIYFPDSSQPPPAEQSLPGGQDVQLTTSDGLELVAWYAAASEADRATVLVAPGNAGNRAARAELGATLTQEGYGVLLLDYRGYGGNPGSPTEEGLARDVRAAHDYLTRQADLGDEDLIYFGESIGAAVVTDLATERPPAGMVLRSPFSSLADVGRSAYGIPVGWLLRDEFAPQADMAGVSTPVAVIYSDADSIVPSEQSRAVAEASRAAGNSTTEIQVAGADHNDPALGHGPEVLEAVERVWEQ